MLVRLLSVGVSLILAMSTAQALALEIQIRTFSNVVNSGITGITYRGSFQGSWTRSPDEHVEEVLIVCNDGNGNRLAESKATLDRSKKVFFGSVVGPSNTKNFLVVFKVKNLTTGQVKSVKSGKYF